MRIDILSCLPKLLESPLSHSIIQRAKDKQLVEIYIHDLREFGFGKHRQLDDYSYGGGAGMVMMVEPIAKAIRKLQAERTYDEIIYLTPDGERLDQGKVNQLSLHQNLILLAGHYKGIDQRARDLFITREISIGDYVLSGGELPALVLTDAIVRLIPGVLSDESSALFDSFQDQLLDAPVYTRPADFEGHTVPDILLSGHEKNIKLWHEEQSLKKTKERRPDLLSED
jgi:tRNA (guanine37-N1)-methyltransferase